MCELARKFRYKEQVVRHEYCPFLDGAIAQNKHHQRGAGVKK